MQNENRLVGRNADSVGKVPFTHVDPSSGRFTGWTIEINDSEEAGRCE